MNRMMKNKISVMLLIIFVLLFFVSTGASANFLVVGYYPEWNAGTYTPQDIPFENLTHINHAFVWPDAQGNLQIPSGFFATPLISKSHQANVQVLISVGGATGSYAFSSMAANSDSRKNFVDKIVQLIQTYGYDGVDIDWEFPQNQSDQNNLLSLMSELRQKLNAVNPNYLLTMAIPSGDWYGRWFRYDVLQHVVDWFNVMTYDFHGSWTNHSGHNAPLYEPATDQCGSVEQSIKYLIEDRKIVESKLLLGLAFYGRKFNTHGLYQASTGGDQTIAFKDIDPLLNGSWIYYWDNVSAVPFLMNSSSTQMITFDDSLSISLKCDYLKQKNLQGAMIWALGHDASGVRQPLLDIVAKKLLPGTGIGKNHSLTPADWRLNVFPNPFNDQVTIKIEVLKRTNLQIQIFDLNGRCVMQKAVKDVSPGQIELHWSAEKYSSGVYWLVGQVGKSTKIKRLVLVK